MKDKIISILLLLVAVMLVGIVGILGYVIYSEIIGEGSIQIDLVGEAGYPTIEYTPKKENITSSTMEPDIFSGVDGENTSIEEASDQYRHLYNQLDSSAKLIYDKLYENKENLKTGTYTIQFGNSFQELLSKENGDEELKKQYQSAIEALVYENPDIFYLDATNMYINIEKITKITGVKYNVYINNGSKTSYLAEGFYSKEDVDRCQAQIEMERDKILAKVNGKSDYEKIKIVHDYLIDNIEYDTTILQSNIYNIYGALVNKKCVCEGYAKAFQYLMNEIGIDNVIVIGTGTNSKSETENHAWNYVKLNDQWYAVDTTWDDPIVVGGGIIPNSSRYQYFLKGSRTMNENHIASGRFTDQGQIFEYPTLSVEDYK